MIIDNTNPLELSAGDMRSMVDGAMSRIVEHIESLPDQPAAMVEDGPALARSLVEPLPEAGTPYAELLDVLFEQVIPCSFNTAGPGYMAYIPGGGLFHSAVADLIADSVNRYVGVWLAAPGLVQLEANVVRWFCDILGFPKRAGGVLTTGGSLANLTAIVTARRERLPEQFFAGTVYTSDQTHHSVQKAAVLAGFPPANVREIPSDERFCVRVDELARQIKEDREAGFTPFFIVGNGGTTNTGGCTSMRPMAGSSCSPSAAGMCCAGSIELIQLPSIPTRGSSYRTATVRCSCAMPRR
jgi:aromatic-L-amino-acid decarboxylase